MVQGRARNRATLVQDHNGPRRDWVPRQSFDGEGRLGSPERPRRLRRVRVSPAPIPRSARPKLPPVLWQSDQGQGQGLRFRVPGARCRRLRGPKFCGSVPLEKTDRFATTTSFPCSR